jgi:hypothetical protein
MKNIFSDEESSEFEQSAVPDDAELEQLLSEVEEEEDESPKSQPIKKANKPATKSAYSLSSNETNVLQIAMVQLDQARLYEMLLKHNLFEGVKANAASLKNVETELKDFILQRLQILLGMKSEKKEVAQAPMVQQKIKVELPFNDVEIEFLKALAFKGTKGESAKSPSTKTVEAQSISSIKAPQEEQVGLRKMSLSSSSFNEAEYDNEDDSEDEEVEDEAPKPRKPVAKPTPQPRPAPRTQNQSSEQIAKEDIKNMAKRKPAHLMNSDELMEASKGINANKRKSSKATPMPDADALAMHYQMQQSKASNTNINSQLMGLLSQKLGFSTNQIQNVGDEE